VASNLGMWAMFAALSVVSAVLRGVRRADRVPSAVLET
jgi:hypothetical protein